MNNIEIIKNFLEITQQAIESGDWKVDGACDPDSVIQMAEKILRDAGYRLDSLTGTEWILDND